MINFQQQVKSAAKDGKLSEKDAIQLAQKADQIVNTAVELLHRACKEVGMWTGEAIEEFMAQLKGHKFSSLEYNYEKPVGDQ